MSKSDVFQLVNERECGDATSWFDVEFTRPITVMEFIEAVVDLNQRLERGEHGTIRIYDHTHPTIEDSKNAASISYNHSGVKFDLAGRSLDLLYSLIYSAKANGGWSLMDYDLYLAAGENHSEFDELNARARFIKTTDEQNERITKIRKAFSDIYNAVEDICESGRETSLVFTKLEEAQFWAIKGITREDVRK